jgi:hypothetical protein
MPKLMSMEDFLARGGASVKTYQNTGIVPSYVAAGRKIKNSGKSRIIRPKKKTKATRFGKTPRYQQPLGPPGPPGSPKKRKVSPRRGKVKILRPRVAGPGSTKSTKRNR